MSKLGLPKTCYLSLVRQALQEDKAHQDITSQILISPQLKTRAQIIAKQELIFCGAKLAKAVFHQVDPRLKFQAVAKEGQSVKAGAVVATMQGKAQSILAGERVALNFLQHLSGVATLTDKYVEQLRGTGVKLLDTRKTLPTFRALARYAVTIGGGVNHRFDLSEAVMVKDNHRALVGSVSEILQRLHAELPSKARSKKIPVMIEVESFTDAKAALAAGAKYLQLDNMKISQLKQAVKYARERCGNKVLIEATGGITLENIRQFALTGVDFISVGAITHSAPAVDLSLEIIP